MKRSIRSGSYSLGQTAGTWLPALRSPLTLRVGTAEMPWLRGGSCFLFCVRVRKECPQEWRCRMDLWAQQGKETALKWVRSTDVYSRPCVKRGFRWLGGKEPGCQGNRHKGQGSIPGSGRSLEEEKATHSSTLAWRIPWMEEPGGLQYARSRHSRTWRSTEQQLVNPTPSSG